MQYTHVLSQRGYSSMLLLVMCIVLALSMLVSQLGTTAQRIEDHRLDATRAALQAAKSALIAAAASNPGRPGGLPCPDLNGDGEAELQCDRPEQRIGRLPWQTLNTGDLRDGSGARLWYAVSGSYRNDAGIAINNRTRGEIELRRLGENGETLAAPEPAVAVIIAPGHALAGQVRGGRGDTERSNFIETEIDPKSPKFTLGSAGRVGNDELVTLARGEIMETVERVVAARLRAEIVPIMRERYIDRWGAAPMGTQDGTFPHVAAESVVHWDLASIEVVQAAGTGVLAGTDCWRSTGRTITCELRYSGDVEVSIRALARNVGRTWTAPPHANDVHADPPASEVWIRHGPFDPDGHARITALVRLPLGTRVRVRVEAPGDVLELTEAGIPVSAPSAWFARNEWFRSLAYQAEPERATIELLPWMADGVPSRSSRRLTDPIRITR